MEICIHFSQCDTDYCTVRHISCACGGDRQYCSDSRYYNITPGQIKKLKRTDFWRRSMATCFPERRK